MVLAPATSRNGMRVLAHRYTSHKAYSALFHGEYKAIMPLSLRDGPQAVLRGAGRPLWGTQDDPPLLRNKAINAAAAALVSDETRPRLIQTPTQRKYAAPKLCYNLQ